MTGDALAKAEAELRLAEHRLQHAATALTDAEADGDKAAIRVELRLWTKASANRDRAAALVAKLKGGAK